MRTCHCGRCGLVIEVDAGGGVAGPGGADVPCPQCGGPTGPVPATGGDDGRADGALTAALHELVGRPGVRLFCTAVSSLTVHVGLLALLVLIGTGIVEGAGEEELPSPISAGIAPDPTPSDATGFRWKGVADTRDEQDAKRDPSRPTIDRPIGGTDDQAAKALRELVGMRGEGAGTAGVTGAGAADAGLNALAAIGRGPSRGGPGGRGGGGNGTGLGTGDRPSGSSIIGLDGLPSARSIVFVVDRSGSMDPMGDLVKTELAKAVGRLRSGQSFNVVWFSDGDALRFNAAGMVPATEDNKSRLLGHLAAVDFRGSTLPVSALTTALAWKPELVYVLTDGNFESDFVDEITRRNAGRSTISCIGFITDDAGFGNLDRLARQNGGKCKLLEAKKLLGG